MHIVRNHASIITDPAPTVKLFSSFLGRHAGDQILLDQRRPHNIIHSKLDLRDELRDVLVRRGVGVVEAVEERGPPPGEVLGAPDPGQGALGIAEISPHAIGLFAKGRYIAGIECDLDLRLAHGTGETHAGRCRAPRIGGNPQIARRFGEAACPVDSTA